MPESKQVNPSAAAAATGEDVYINTAFDGSEDETTYNDIAVTEKAPPVATVEVVVDDFYNGGLVYHVEKLPDASSLQRSRRSSSKRNSVDGGENGSSASSSRREMNKFSRTVETVQRHTSEFFRTYGQTVKTLVYVTLVLGYAGYFAYALYYDFDDEQPIRLLWVTMLVVVCFLICIIQDHFGVQINKYFLDPIVNFVSDHSKIFKITAILIVVLGYVMFLIFGVALMIPYNLVSFGGLVTYLVLMFLYSANRSAVRWRPVLWGLLLQFIFAVLVLRTVAGYEAFKWIGDRVQEFMAYSDEGAKFVFGDNFEEHFFAMKILPVIIYFSATISMLYYMGVMQAVILKISWVMQKTLGTTAGESVNAAGNIFIGQTEAPLLIRPLIADMTESELHAVITGGYATIAGSVMATYIQYGVPANHLISASIMAAPCALGLSKLCYPETVKKEKDDIAAMEKSPESNFVEAAAAGAIAAIPLCANIAANLIAFISLLAFVDATLTWFGHRVGLYEPELTFQFICSYVLWPLAFVMGVAVEDCRKLAEMIGIKIFLNEYIAYTELSVYIANTETFDAYTAVYGGNWTQVNDDIYLTYTNTTLVGGIMQQRSIIISTYALCGFANISSIGTVIGALAGMVPHRRSEIARLATRAMIVGNVVCFMNACTAGLLYEEGSL